MKKRVLITTGIFPPDIGGPATFLSYLAEDLGKFSYAKASADKADFKVSVLTFGKKPASAEGYGEARAGDYSFPVKKVQSKAAFLLNIFLMSWKADVVYAQDLYSAGFCSFLVKKIFPKKRLVVRFVGDSAWEKSVSAGAIEDDLMLFNQKKYDAKTEKLKKRRLRILQAADAIITVSEFLKKVLLAMGIEEGKIKVIYNSVDFLREQFEALLDKKRFKVSKGLFTISEKSAGGAPASAEAMAGKCTGMCASCGGHEISTDGKIILTIARLVKWKGIEALIEIMPDLAAKYGDVKLVVLGDGPERGGLEEKVKEAKRFHSPKGTMEPTEEAQDGNLEVEKGTGFRVKPGMTGDIIFLKGKVKHRETLDYLKIADIFVLNTNYEGLSHTLLEAMSIGIPIVTTSAGGNIETIENEKTGLLVDFNDKAQLKKAIGRLLENKDLAKNLAQNAKKSLDKFNWKKLVEETGEILKAELE